MAAGKRVGILSFPGADNESENQRRKGDFGIRYHSKEANAFLFRSTNSQFFPILNWDASLSYSQPKAVPVVFKEEVINENGLVVESERTIYLNKSLIKLPFQNDDVNIRLSYNIPGVYQSFLKGIFLPIEKGTYNYRINSKSKTWPSWEDWCREVVWYENKKGAYLYSYEQNT